MCFKDFELQPKTTQIKIKCFEAMFRGFFLAKFNKVTSKQKNKKTICTSPGIYLLTREKNQKNP